MQLLANGEGAVGVERAVGILRSGGTALDAVEQGIRDVEADPSVHSVGVGGIPNLQGEVECDAAIMEGSSRMAGSVAALQGFRHAISVARAVMERLPHVFLAGEGAARFAREVGAETAEMVTDVSREKYRRWMAEYCPYVQLPLAGSAPIAQAAWDSARVTASKGTTVFLARDQDGHLAVGASSSGWPYKYPGRIGDSPIVGAGLYVDDRYGACACTHTGERTMRTLTAHAVVQLLKAGAGLSAACAEAFRDLGDLPDGLLGPVMIHVMDKEGRSMVATDRDLGENTYAHLWEGSKGEPGRVVPHLCAPTAS